MFNLSVMKNAAPARKAEKWLQDKGIRYEKRPIKEENPTAEELRTWREKSGLPLKRFFNTSGQLYRSSQPEGAAPRHG